MAENGATSPSARLASNKRFPSPERPFVVTVVVFRSCPLPAIAWHHPDQFKRVEQGLALLHLAKRLQVWHPIRMNDAMNLDRACWWRSF